MRRFLAAALLSVPVVAIAPAASTAETQMLARSVAAFVDEVNTGQVNVALGHLTSDVSITEDLAPFRWQGAHAGSDWLTAMQKNGESMGMTDIQMRLGSPLQVLVHGDVGYEAVPGVVTLKGKQRTVQEKGLLTFALKKEAGVWKINSFAWGGAAAQ
jgi:ketosteroid isomerase-like protein